MKDRLRQMRYVTVGLSALGTITAGAIAGANFHEFLSLSSSGGDFPLTLFLPSQDASFYVTIYTSAHQLPLIQSAIWGTAAAFGFANTILQSSLLERGGKKAINLSARRAA